MTQDNAALVLRTHFDRILSFEEDRKAASEAISAEWQALKNLGFNLKAAKEAFRRLHKMEDEERELAKIYEEAVGTTPLEKLIDERAA